MTSRRLLGLWRALGRGLPGGDDRTEPLPYRAWKRLWQLRSRSRGGWRSDLFDRLAAVDWDAVIILDACRRDVLASVADDAVVGRARSPATATGSFLRRARDRGLFADATYVSGNPQSGDHPPGAADHVPVYDDGWDDDLATVPPAAVYDAARDRLDRGERVVAHTIQPHYPHVCEVDGRLLPVPEGVHPRYLDDEADRDRKLQVLLANGRIDPDRTERSYRSSVAFAWRAASAFAAALAAEGRRTVITADHGELFGEYGFVEHPVDVNVRPLVEVPWVRFEPAPAGGAEGGDGDAAVADRLAALGYAEG
jgi:hypothetical protein